MHAAVVVAQIADLPVGGIAESVAFDGAEGAADAFGDVGAAVVGDDEAAARNEIDETLEGGLDGFEIGVDVGVVELDVSEDERVRKVVEELGALVEEGGVVLVAFDDEGARGAELEAGAEVFSDAADEKRGLERGMFARGDLVDPGEHAGGGGFAVGSGDDERFAAGEEFFAQERGHGGEGNALVEDALDFRIAAGERIADDDEIGSGVEIRFGVGLEDGNAERAKQIAHGRIGSFVRTGDAMALELQQAGERGHGRAADADEMNVARRCSHFATAGSRMRRLAVSPTVSSASTPKVSVTFSRETWPLRRPIAMGTSTPTSALRMASSRSDGGAPGDAQSSISPKTMPRDAVELSGMTQLPEHAIDLIRLDAGVLKKKQLAFGARLPRRAEQ